MAISKARHRANEKYNAKAYEEIKVRVPKGKKELIQSSAKTLGKSTNAYINDAIDRQMKGGGGSGFHPENEDKNSISRPISHVGLLLESEIETIKSLLHEGQTIEDYVKLAVLEKIKADTEKIK